jgi:Family of unknown function (DUF6314)
MNALETVFASLPGRWEMARSIPNAAQFTGLAEIRVIDEITLEYREEGVMRLTRGQAFRANRIYFFKKQPEVMAVYFGDGLSRSKIFLRLAFKSSTSSAWPLVAQDDHQCNCDLHQAEYKFNSRDEFSVVYWVKGPKTNYVVQTAYTRI